jgi:hypothetical protein
VGDRQGELRGAWMALHFGRPDRARWIALQFLQGDDGYDLATRCPAKKPDELDLIKLRFAESARAMLVESNAIKPTGLIYCGK